MGRRTRKARPAGDRPAGYARAEARNAEIRATLRPLAPGERPGALKVAIAAAVLIAVANLVLWATGFDVQGEDPGLLGALLPAAVMGIAAWGMWRGRYWAVLGFQAFLGIAIIYGCFALMVASNLAGAALAIAVVALAGTLFWKLVRVMGRMQAPRPPR